MQESDNSYQKIFSEVKRLGALQLENGKLLLTEKLTLLTAKVTLTAVVFVMTTAAMIFASIAVAYILLKYLSPTVTYSIVGAFYVIVAVIAVVFRKQLIIDPIARYISRVILDPPSHREESHSVSHSYSLRSNDTSDE